jgi:hypothetical protein
MNRYSARRRGYMIGEMIVTCALLSLAATLAASMMYRLFETGHSLRVDEQEGLKIDAAIAQLRRDVEPSVIGPMKDGVLTTDYAQWTVRDNSLVRRGFAEQSFGPLPTPIQMSADGKTVELQIGQAHWTFAQLNPKGDGQ